MVSANLFLNFEIFTHYSLEDCLRAGTEEGSPWH